jgi:hypothetical protein
MLWIRKSATVHGVQPAGPLDVPRLVEFLGLPISLRRVALCILASLYLRRNYASIFRSAQSLQLRTAQNLVKGFTRSISATLKCMTRPAKGYYRTPGIADALGDAFEMHAHEIHAYKVHSHKVHAHEVHAYEVHGH